MNSMIPAAALAAAMPTPDAFPIIRNAAEAIARAGLARRGDFLRSFAHGDDHGLRRHRRRRPVGLEIRLRRLRSRADPVSAQIRQRHSRARGVSRRRTRDARCASPRSFPPIRAAPKRARRCSNSRRRFLWRSSPRKPQRSRPPIWCSNRPPARACSRSLPNSLALDSRSTNSPTIASRCCAACFRRRL